MSDAILKKSNHYNFDDCHPQYVSKTQVKIVPHFTDITSPYYALAYPRVYNDNTSIFWKAFIFNSDSGKISSAEIEVKINVGKLTNDSTISASAVIKNKANFDGNSILISMANVANGKVFYIYLKQNAIGKSYLYQVQLESSTRNNRFSYDIGYGSVYRKNFAGTKLFDSLDESA
nr:MAG TPA: hypothetical protein [Caudoviricetes sp.]